MPLMPFWKAPVSFAGNLVLVYFLLLFSVGTSNQHAVAGHQFGALVFKAVP